MSWMTMLFNAEGRIRRRDFWIWMIGKFFGAAILFLAAFLIISALRLSENGRTFAILGVYSVLLGALATANVCLIAKRWHDMGKSGWRFMIIFIPFVGVLWTLIECGLVDGTPGRNQYGRSPKGLGNERAAF